MIFCTTISNIFPLSMAALCCHIPCIVDHQSCCLCHSNILFHWFVEYLAKRRLAWLKWNKYAYSKYISVILFWCSVFNVCLPIYKLTQSIYLGEACNLYNSKSCAAVGMGSHSSNGLDTDQASSFEMLVLYMRRHKHVHWCSLYFISWWGYQYSPTCIAIIGRATIRIAGYLIWRLTRHLSAE